MTFPTGNESAGYSLFGMPVEVSKFLPDNIVMAVDPGDEDKTVVMDVKTGWVSNVCRYDAELASDGESLTEDVRRAIALHHDNAYFSALLGATTTTTATAETLDLLR